LYKALEHLRTAVAALLIDLWIMSNDGDNLTSYSSNYTSTSKNGLRF